MADKSNLKDFASFPVDAERLPVMLAYGNEMFIADEVLPLARPVSAYEFKYSVFARGSNFKIPDMKVGRMGEPNTVERSATDATGTVEDYALKEAVPEKDINEGMTMGYDPLADATESLTEVIKLGREKRVSDLVFAAGTYGANNKDNYTLAAEYWNADGNPIQAITAGANACLRKPNVLVLGRDTWAGLSTNPFIVKAIHGNSGDAGIVSQQQFAVLFGLQKVLVGESWYDSAAEGQAESRTQLWGKHAALLHINPTAGRDRKGVTFGASIPYKERYVVKTVRDERMGLRGGYWVIAGETIDEVIMAADVGFFFQNAVS